MPQIQHLLFDLDDTLYTDETGLFVEVGARIQDWTQRALNVSQDEAERVRNHYFNTYGTTMSGLLRDHPELDIDDYLDYVHDVDITKYLDPAPELDAMLSRLPAPKSVFTNSITSWAQRITRHLGIRHHFERVFDVRAVGYRSKPDPHAFEVVLSALDLPGEACVLLDDRAFYLEGAAAAGIHTILVRKGARATGAIEAAVGHILEAEPIILQLLKGD